MSLPKFVEGMTHLGADDKQKVAAAYEFARQAHHTQKRKSGEAYITHPMAVAIILEGWRADIGSIQAGVLHDVIEDTAVTKEELSERFGEEIADLVDGVSKIGMLYGPGAQAMQTRSVENIRKLLLAMSQDIRVILVKLADRLHNMRTIRHLSETKQLRIARETLDIFAPLADRLGMGDVKAELEDLSFAVVDRSAYNELMRQAQPYIKEGKALLDLVIPKLEAELGAAGIQAQIEHRIKHTYSLYRKLEKYDHDFTKIRDLVALRIITPDTESCYQALGIVHALYKPLPHYIKDYIAVPKPNGYQSIHTTVLGRKHIFEVQIRSQAMHEFAERGLAAHFYYDEQKGLSAHKNTSAQQLPKKFEWVQNLLDWQEQIANIDELKESFRLDLFKTRIFVFSPKGDLYDLPEGSTPVDFAFQVHTQLGLSCRGAKVNDQIVPLDYRLENRDIVEIFAFSKEPRPNRDWLGFVVSTKARSRIKAWFRVQDQSSEERKGRQQLDEYLVSVKRPGWGQLKPMQRAQILQRIGVENEQALFVSLSDGSLRPQDVARELMFDKVVKRPSSLMLPEFMKRRRRARPVALIPGIEREHISRAGCCSPQYPEEIVGFVSRLGVFRIHTKACSQLDDQRERCVPAYWYFDSSDKLRIYGQAAQTAAILKGISHHLHGFDGRARSVKETVKGDEVQFDIDLSLVRMDRLPALVAALRRLPGINQVEHMVQAAGTT
jgi:GTP pyrophosphokinase